jgi:hypothetical protein
MKTKTTAIKWTQFTKRTNYPKLGYIIKRLKDKRIACRFNGESWHAPILDVDDSKFKEALAILGERHYNKFTLDDARDDHPKFFDYRDEKPTHNSSK